MYVQTDKLVIIMTLLKLFSHTCKIYFPPFNSFIFGQPSSFQIYWYNITQVSPAGPVRAQTDFGLHPAALFKLRKHMKSNEYLLMGTLLFSKNLKIAADFHYCNFIRMRVAENLFFTEIFLFSFNYSVALQGHCVIPKNLQKERKN